MVAAHPPSTRRYSPTHHIDVHCGPSALTCRAAPCATDRGPHFAAFAERLSLPTPPSLCQDPPPSPRSRLLSSPSRDVVHNGAGTCTAGHDGLSRRAGCCCRTLRRQADRKGQGAPASDGRDGRRNGGRQQSHRRQQQRRRGRLPEQPAKPAHGQTHRSVCRQERSSCASRSSPASAALQPLSAPAAITTSRAAHSTAALGLATPPTSPNTRSISCTQHSSLAPSRRAA